ncbi:hypothetical protein [Saccharothrix algeriensis]|uniref:DNA gyrase inhibitor GyrI n=2 Tax=Saccharothrix algeriensis TaxID=173560 RepID=A0ABS2SFL3_9PSEU|nr:hypothetical protein [Saccharothrix algeriensis]MBM7814725.1 DNA gyrase inhibitor GyrI [Saccharothrix algeriensis]
MRTDEPEVLEGLRVQFCTTGTPPTQKVTAEVLWPNETPGGDCAVVAVPSPDETGSSAAARFVDDRGAQELDAEAPKAACVVKDVDILTIYIPEAADPPGCNLVS